MLTVLLGGRLNFSKPLMRPLLIINQNHALQEFTKTPLVNSFGEYRGRENHFLPEHQVGSQQPCRYNL